MTAASENRPQMRWAVLAFAVAIVVALLRVGVLTELAGVRLGARWAMLDFHSGVYYPVRALLTGENPYDRARFLSLYPVSDGFPPYPPFTLLLHLPFGLLPPFFPFIPLPSKIVIQYLQPVHLRETYGDDPDLDEIYDDIVGRMQDVLTQLQRERRLPVLG